MEPPPSAANIHLYPGCIDTHTHLSMVEDRGVPLSLLLTSCWQAGMTGLLDVAIDEGDMERRLSRARRHRGRVWLSAGLHPLACEGELGPRLEALDEQLRLPEVVAVGECGLDFYRSSATRYQYQSLQGQLDLAVKHQLPLIVHNRHAGAEIARMLVQQDLPAGGVLHCFDGDMELARTLLTRGFYFSFAGNLTYKKADALRQAAMELPLNRLLVETDAPFLSPQPCRRHLNQPGYLGHTLDALAALKKVEVGALVQQLALNFRRLFAPPSGDALFAACPLKTHLQHSQGSSNSGGHA